MSTTETPEQALARIQSMGFGKNDAMAIMAFANCGINPDDITPRENVLTFRAWKAVGRQVAKGASSVRVTVWIPCKDTKAQAGADGEQKQRMRPKTCSLFHISQTIPQGSPKGTRPDAWNNPALVKPGTYEPEVEPLTDKQRAFVESPGDTWQEKVINAADKGIVTDANLAKSYTEETFVLDDDGNLVKENDVCNCPMAGVVTNVDCPLHGTRRLETVH